VGFSCYLWSFPFFAEIARALRKEDPSRLIVFGGPSARPIMFDLEPFRDLPSSVDVLVLGEGERAFLQIVSDSERTFESLSRIPGLAIRMDEGRSSRGNDKGRGPRPDDEGWNHTPEADLVDLNELPSPYSLGLVPSGGLGVLQTYRGCPFTCTFCEWGVLETPSRVRSVDELMEEFEGMERAGVMGALLVDAGLNLNPAAFKNLAEAVSRSKFFDKRLLICEVYPMKVADDHLEFLASIGRAHVGVGLQSFDKAVLDNIERSYDEMRFEDRIDKLTQVAGIAVEIILGLPGDSPSGFMQTFERARQLPGALRVYHCVVLPSALMTRGLPEFDMDYDPLTLKMRSCLGWSAEDLQECCDFVTRQAQAQDGIVGQYFWVFSP